MKKLLLQILFLMLMLPAISQNYASITGTVTDISTGNPIPNQAVTISSDSSAGWFYYQTVYTNNSGFYIDTVPVPPSVQGVLFVRTIDCQNYMHQVVLTLAPPVLNFTADFIICYNSNPCQANFTSQQQQPLTVQFMDASVGGGTTRQWMFGDGANSSQMNPVHAYGMPGYYNVTLTIGALGTTCYQVTTQTIYVWDSVSPGCHAAFMIIPDSMNTLNTYHFFNQSTGNISTYIWSFGDGSSQTVTLPGNPNVIHTYAQAGIYNACLSIQSADSSCFDVTCDTLVVGTPPACHAAFTYYTDSVNTSNTIHFIDLSAGNNLTWNWNFGDGTYSTLQNPVHTYTTPGYFVVELSIASQNPSCSDVVSGAIYIGSGPGCQAHFSYSIDPVVGNHTVNFTDQSTGNPTTWLWSFGDGSAGNVQNPTHAYNAPGNYAVCLTITGDSCTSTFCSDVVIIDSVTSHQVYGFVSEGNIPLALGMAMIFSVDTSANYQPYVAVCPIDSAGMYYFSLVPDGNYYIMAIPFDSNNYLPTYYGNTINWEQATVIALGTANNPYNINLVQSDQMTPGPGSAGGQISMTGLKTSMMDKINMILMNEQGKPIGFTKVSSSGVFSFPSMAYGTYYLHPEMPGISGDQVKITLSPAIPHADVIMTFNGNRIMGTTDKVALANRWAVYPNPVSDKLTVTIDMKQGTRAEAGITDMKGQVVVNVQVSLNAGANSVEINTTALPSGIYSLRIYSAEGVILTTKLVKTR
ncbi:MAG: PKD domain-containing protein [Bacteroidetes bacterium]|nr:PKD domain-containing protein [Bacteroidota bacterium]